MKFPEVPRTLFSATAATAPAKGAKRSSPIEPIEPDEPDESDEDSLEEATGEFVEVIESTFRQRARAEEQRMRDATDSEHWFAVCFHTRERKEEFLRKLAEKFGAVGGDKYVSGDELAAALGITLEGRKPAFAAPRIKDWSRWTR